jgi:hypothetical protein
LIPFEDSINSQAREHESAMVDAYTKIKPADAADAGAGAGAADAGAGAADGSAGAAGAAGGGKAPATPAPAPSPVGKAGALGAKMKTTWADAD